MSAVNRGRLPVNVDREASRCVSLGNDEMLKDLAGRVSEKFLNEKFYTMCQLELDGSIGIIIRNNPNFPSDQTITLSMNRLAYHGKISLIEDISERLLSQVPQKRTVESVVKIINAARRDLELIFIPHHKETAKKEGSEAGRKVQEFYAGLERVQKCLLSIVDYNQDLCRSMCADDDVAEHMSKLSKDHKTSNPKDCEAIDRLVSEPAEYVSSEFLKSGFNPFLRMCNASLIDSIERLTYNQNFCAIELEQIKEGVSTLALYKHEDVIKEIINATLREGRGSDCVRILNAVIKALEKKIKENPDDDEYTEMLHWAVDEKIKYQAKGIQLLAQLRTW